MSDSEKKPVMPDKKEDIVITPAGPRQKSQIHQVGPGEAVRRNPDGTHTVIRENPANDCEKEKDNA